MRELQNVIQRSLILLAGGALDAADLVFEQEAPATESGRAPASAGLHDDVRQHEYERILAALRAHDGVRTAAAKSLGISPRTLRYKG